MPIYCSSVPHLFRIAFVVWYRSFFTLEPRPETSFAAFLNSPIHPMIAPFLCFLRFVSLGSEGRQAGSGYPEHHHPPYFTPTHSTCSLAHLFAIFLSLRDSEEPRHPLSIGTGSGTLLLSSFRPTERRVFDSLVDDQDACLPRTLHLVVYSGRGVSHLIRLPSLRYSS